MFPISATEKLIVSTLFLVSVIYQMLYFILDDRTPNTDPKNAKYSKRWHGAGGISRLATAWVFYRAFGWEWGVSMAVVLWVWFDGSINTWVLHKEWWYVGTTAQTDKALRWIGKKVNADPRALNAVIKSFAVAAVVTLLLIKIFKHG